MQTLNSFSKRTLFCRMNCTNSDDEAKQSTSEQVIFLSITVVLVILSGLFSGLNLGLMSFTDDDLRIVIEGSTDPKEVGYAKRIRPLRKRGNLLLCTLLLGNTLVNAMIAILLADIASGVVGGLVTTGLIVVFGEITPQSICSRYALAIGARSVPVVWVFLILCFPIAFPISLILDWVLGREMGGIYSRGELIALITMNTCDPERAKETGLTEEDGKILKGALNYSHKLVHSIMTPIEDVFSLPITAVLDKPTMSNVLERGHTRIPVYDGPKDNIVALMYCRDLTGVGWERKMSVKTVIETVQGESRLYQVSKSMEAKDAFSICKKERRHLLVVTDERPEGSKAEERLPALGVVTLEDIIEEIIQDEIVGEEDEFVENKTPVAKNSSRTLNAKRGNPHALLNSLKSQYGSDALEAGALPGTVDESLH
mmetsp:Transcript_101399/g.194486  ORF Transcript_101399/g.194486 Transcript_101399/m.194486 type:complete len:427 (+) Transcript_101399:2-1282(+)